MEIEIKLDKSKPRKKGHPIIISIFVSKDDRQYPVTGYYAFPDQWNEIKSEPKKNHPLYHGLYEYVYNKKLIINKLTERKQYRTSEQIKNAILGNNYESMTAFWESFIEELNSNGKKGNARYHESNLLAFKKFKPNIFFHEINYDFLIKFRDFHLNRKRSNGENALSNNGVIIYLRGIKTVYREALKRKLFIPEDFNNPFQGIMPKSEPTKDKYFTIDEMGLIVSTSGKHKYYDYFMLCFLLGGIDYIDLYHLRYSHIKNGRIKFERFKGGTNEIIDNYVFPEAMEILDKYKDDSGYLVPLWQNESNSYRGNYITVFRKWLKKIGIESYFTSKTPRYTFINIGKQLFLNRDIIMELTGHSHGDVHSIYEGKFPHHVKDEVHRKIIDAVLED